MTSTNVIDARRVLQAVRLRMGIALLAGMALVAAPVAATPAAADAWPSAWTEAEEQMLDHINEARQAEGLGILHADLDVREVARDWSETMPVDGFKHRERFWELYPEGWTAGGENIGYASMRSSLEATTTLLHELFMDSPGHHANIVGERFTHAGVGLYVDDQDRVWVTVNFMDHPERAAAADSGSDDADEVIEDTEPDDDADAPKDTSEDTTDDPVKLPIDSSLSFLDVDATSVHGGAILRMASAGIISGYEDGTFRPGNSLTRAQLATLLVRQLDLEVSGTAPRFSDVSSSHPHADSIRAVASHGIVGGYDDGTFRPGQALTRAQAATMLVRAFDVAEASRAHGFRDVGSGDVHAPAIAAAAEAGIVGGYDDGTFRPGSSLTRAQIATILDRLHG